VASRRGVDVRCAGHLSREQAQCPGLKITTVRPTSCCRITQPKQAG
jgi:hypothetical protein